jgi:hypothetical protein
VTIVEDRAARTAFDAVEKADAPFSNPFAGLSA